MGLERCGPGPPDGPFDVIDALTTPLPGGGEEPVQKQRRLSIDRRSATQSESVDSLPAPTPADPANKLDLSQFQGIGPP